MKRIFLFVGLVVVVLLLSSFFFYYSQIQFLPSRASVSPASFSIDNSYVFVTPLRAKADGKEQIRLTVFLLNNQGLGVLGKDVVIQNTADLHMNNSQATSDSLGKAFFDISSSVPGEYYISVSVDGQILPQQAHLSFY